jgi:hypothetical protein
VPQVGRTRQTCAAAQSTCTGRNTCCGTRNKIRDTIDAIWNWRAIIMNSDKEYRAMDLEKILRLKKHSKFPVDRFHFLAGADASIIKKIDRGILFLMALWSLPSAYSFAYLTSVIAALDKSGSLEIVVTDVDGSPELYVVPEFLGSVHGCGEMAWIRNGKIITTSGRGLSFACIEPNTTALLTMP